MHIKSLHIIIIIIIIQHDATLSLTDPAGQQSPGYCELTQWEQRMNNRPADIVKRLVVIGGKEGLVTVAIKQVVVVQLKT